MLKHVFGACAILVLAVGQQAQAITIEFDYSLDKSDFFTAERRNVLDHAASYFTTFTDKLAAITPPAGESWSATVRLGADSTGTVIANPSIAANTLRIYIAGANLTGATLGRGGAGGANFSTSNSTFADAILSRGQANATGPTARDFASWGGGIVFDTDIYVNNVSYSWNFDINNGPANNTQVDFLSVAVHELAHVLGVGGAESWFNNLSGNVFAGPAATSVNGSSPAVYLPDHAHLAEGTMSKLPSTGLPQEAAMDPSLMVGKRKLLTVLDYALLKDVGWEVPANLLTTVPEPASMAMLGIGGAMLLARRKR